METPHERKLREFLAREPFNKRNISDGNLSTISVALTHKSYSNEAGNEIFYKRLEFLGDAVIELIVREHLYRNTKGNVKDMSDAADEIVANDKISLKILEKGLDLDSVALVGHGHMDPITKENIIEDNMRADFFEALIGALYLVYGLEDCKTVVEKILL